MTANDKKKREGKSQTRQKEIETQHDARSYSVSIAFQTQSLPQSQCFFQHPPTREDTLYFVQKKGWPTRLKRTTEKKDSSPPSSLPLAYLCTVRGEKPSTDEAARSSAMAERADIVNMLLLCCC